MEGIVVARFTEVGRRVMEVVIRSPGWDLEEVMMECAGLTWNQVFLEVDRLSPERYVTLQLDERGHYSVRPVQRTMRAS
jgi:hypothetical protein